jgi:hypothetical protein
MNLNTRKLQTGLSQSTSVQQVPEFVKQKYSKRQQQQGLFILTNIPHCELNGQRRSSKELDPRAAQNHW